MPRKRSRGMAEVIHCEWPKKGKGETAMRETEFYVAPEGRGWLPIARDLTDYAEAKRIARSTATETGARVNVHGALTRRSMAAYGPDGSELNHPHLDDRDRAILAERAPRVFDHKGPREGHVVEFACGKVRRISYVWRDETDAVLSVQTSDGGSFYLTRDGLFSMSGSLFTGVSPDSLTATDRTADVSAWFFSHEWAGKDRGVPCTVAVPVWTCRLNAPTR